MTSILASRVGAPARAFSRLGLALLALGVLLPAWSSLRAQAEEAAEAAPAQRELSAEEQRLGPKLDLAVLYAGSPGTPRAESFERLLKQHVREVGITSYPKFREEEADAYDVVILDVTMRFTERSIGIGPQPKLSPTYSRATILVNGPGILIADRQLGSKIDWL